MFTTVIDWFDVHHYQSCKNRRFYSNEDESSYSTSHNCFLHLQLMKSKWFATKKEIFIVLKKKN